MKPSIISVSGSADIVAHVLRAERVLLRRLDVGDADFVIELLNEPSFREFIGDKAVQSVEDAQRYLAEGPIASYERHGFGLFLVSLLTDDTRLGICGLVVREGFDDPDLGFAFLRRHWSKGYALEAARAVMNYAEKELQLDRVIAMADRDNHASVKLLDKLGFVYERMVRMPDESEDVCLFAKEI